MIEFGVEGEGVSEKDLLIGRSCIISESGAGKSHGVTVVCEGLAEKNLGFCIIDTTGEHFSFKKEFDVLWVGGDEADLNVNSVSLKELALKVIKENIPVVLDVSDFKKSFDLVKDWITELYQAASDVKNPYLLVIEEADKFIPQKGSKVEVIQDIAKKGRRKGLGLLLATQKPGLISKELLSKCSHHFIGKLTAEDDINAVRQFFTSRKNLYSLSELLPGEFFMTGFGPKESLFKFKDRLTKKSDTRSIKRSSRKVKEFIQALDVSRGLGVKEELDLSAAKEVALRNCRKKHLLFGEKEVVESVRMFYRPLIELSLDVPSKKLFRKELVTVLAYLTPDLIVVDSDFSIKFDLSFMKGLSKREVNVLISMLYDGSRTIDEIISKTGFFKEELREVLSDLVNKGFVAHTGWTGTDRVFKVVKDIALPRIVSIASDKIEPGVTVNEEFSFNEKLIARVVKLLNPDVTILGAKVIYYPFYKVILKRGNASRELFINGVTGRVS